MNLKKIVLIILFSVVFISSSLYSQDKSKVSLSNKPVRIAVIYRELITDDNGLVNKSSEQLISLNKLINDSILLWANKFDLAKTNGFSSFGTFVGEKLNIPLNKKIELSFIDNNGDEESFLLLSQNNHKFEFEKIPTYKR